MALLDDLLAQVTEPGLRREIEAEVNRLRKRARFGLVFERHRPEVTRLYGRPIRAGDLVQRREPTGSTIWRVRAVKGRNAVLEDVETSAELDTMKVTDLVQVRRFGEPLYPGLRHVGGVHRGDPSKGSHVVICGENYDSLQMLTILHEKQVDAIYLDPPYNVGTRDWKYNNDYVDKNDGYRHSKWLSMMERRLKLCGQLLKDDGVLVVTPSASSRPVPPARASLASTSTPTSASSAAASPFRSPAT
jgi:adenine-specific DNA-methyltransferase